MFYNDQQRRDMEDDIHMRVDCINIRNSAACQGTCQLLHEVTDAFNWCNVLKVFPHFSLFVLLRRAEPAGGEDA